MANELTITTALNYSNSGDILNRSGNNIISVSSAFRAGNVVDVATSDTPLGLGSVATPGILRVKNMDATNFITLGSDGSNYPIKLKPGEEFAFRWNGAAIHAKADTATCKLSYDVLSD